MCRLPKTLVLTHFAADSNNGSIRHLEALFERYPEDLVWFAIKHQIKPAHVSVPYTSGHYVLRPHKLVHYLNYGPGALLVAKRAAEFGRAHGVRAVLAVMSGEAIVSASLVARALGVPLSVWVADDPPSVIGHHDLPTPIPQFVMQRFRSTMRKARSHGVISTALADLYRERYGIDAAVLYKGVDPATCLTPRELNATDEIVIGSVGTINSDENWQMLQAAVKQLNARGGRRYKILHVGELAEHLRGPDVEETGWVEPTKLAPHLAKFHLCYLSLWFDEKYRTNSRTAFPTKMISYMQAQRPILAFSIRDSKIVRTIEEHGCGVACTEPSVDALVASIDRILEPQTYSAATIGMRRLTDAYSIDKYYRTFETLVQRAVASPTRATKLCEAQ